MSIVLALYLADVCSGLSVLFFLIGVVFTVGLVAFFIGFCESDDKEDEKQYGKYTILFIIGCLTCFLISIFIPSKTTLLAYAGMNLGKEISVGVQSNQTYQKLIKVLDKKLDIYLTEQEKK